VIRSALYRGHLTHTRRDRFARRTFRYPVYVAAIDPTELPALHTRLHLFAHNSRGVFALHDDDFEGTAGLGLAAAHAARVGAGGLHAPEALRVITNLRVAGYVFNPVSFFLGYQGGELAHAVAEVNNTYGGRHAYVLGPDQRVPGPGAPRYRRARELFVSPFLHGPLSYDFRFETPLDGDELTIQMDVHDDGGARVFVAHLTGARVPLTDRALAAAALRYPLMTAQVIGLIHFQALKLHARGVPFRRPGPDHRPAPAEP
jgi:DUF1365 family protein